MTITLQHALVQVSCWFDWYNLPNQHSDLICAFVTSNPLKSPAITLMEDVHKYAVKVASALVCLDIELKISLALVRLCGYKCTLCISPTHTDHITVLSDKNECSHHNGGCQVNCINLPGSFACSCNPGSRLLPDKRSCEREFFLVLCLLRKHGSNCFISNVNSIQSNHLKNITLHL